MAVLGLALFTGSLVGQRSALREVRDEGTLGLTFVVAQPLGAFRRTGDVAAGLAGFGVVGLGRSTTLGLRIDGAYMTYDAAYRGYGVSTNSSIGTLAIGPQLTLGQGPLRLYGFGTVGGSLFWSAVTYAGGCGCYDSDDFMLDGHFTATKQLGAGLLVAVSRRVALDIGVREVRHDRVQYVPAGGIQDHGDGTFTVHRVETPVDLRVFQVGVSIGVR